MRRRIDLARRALKILPSFVEIRPDRRQSVADRIEARARTHPERPFLLFDGGSREGSDSRAMRVVSYRELNAAANRVAWWALHRGLRRGDVVALLMENRPEYVIAWAGLAKAGVTTALLNTNLTGRALRHALAAAGTGTLVVGAECLDRFATTQGDLERPLEVWVAGDPGAAHALPDGAHGLDADLATRSDANPDPSVRDAVRCGDDLFFIYTSGTTGLPKAAHFSHMRFLGAGFASALCLRLDSHDVHYCALPLYHSAGGIMMVSAVLAAGATLALRRRFSASAFWDDCRRFGATRFQYIGEFCRYLLNQPPDPSDRDHRVRIVLGNGLRPDIWQAFQERFGIEEIVEFYAATEGNAMFANLEGKVGSVGRIPFGPLGRRFVQTRIFRFDVEREEHARDEDGFCIECAPGEVGELLGRISDSSPMGRFEGYTSKEATERKTLRNVLEPGDAWFRSGDLLKKDEDGWLFFVDRIGDTFRWKGENVSTQEVAEILSGFPGIEMVNVYGVQIDGMEGRAGMAALMLQLAQRKRFDPQAFYAYVEENLPRYAVPLFLRLIDEADITGTFKLRKRGLQEEGFDVDRIDDPVFFRDIEAKSYVPLTRRLRKEVLAGDRRL
jgi:fatty-acyl-CoA synthase